MKIKTIQNNQTNFEKKKKNQVQNITLADFNNHYKDRNYWHKARHVVQGKIVQNLTYTYKVNSLSTKGKRHSLQMVMDQLQSYAKK